jgi:DNA ligase 1
VSSILKPLQSKSPDASSISMTTRWGRIGSAGQSKTKTFADPQAAANAIAVLIEEKTDEGYVERPR